MTFALLIDRELKSTFKGCKTPHSCWKRQNDFVGHPRSSAECGRIEEIVLYTVAAKFCI